MSDLRGRSFLTLMDYSPEEIQLLLDTAADLKRTKQAHIPHATHKGKSIALLFEKTSTRTRCAFEVAAADLGINAVYLGQGETQFGKKESTEDTARVLGRMFDGIEFRGFAHQTVKDLAEFSGVPVWNGLTDEFHPTQVLADFLTIIEHTGKLKGSKLVFVGDGSDNVSNSLMIGAAKMGVHYVIATPDSLQPPAELIEKAKQLAENSGGSINITSDLMAAVDGADVLYTDVWMSMGQEDQMADRIEKLRNYQVNMDVVRATHNPNVKFLHCLPAFHDQNTVIGREVYEKFGLGEMEVTDEVFRSPHSIVFDQSENRLHTIKALMALTL
ncbi:ornithine carbamoyltransferase [Candidatus Saccharibacteria bacterium]|nr:ornithine carbamoyltransferase [Candidatus Saccharibacteria bacterium]